MACPPESIYIVPIMIVLDSAGIIFDDLYNSIFSKQLKSFKPNDGLRVL